MRQVVKFAIGFPLAVLAASLVIDYLSILLTGRAAIGLPAIVREGIVLVLSLAALVGIACLVVVFLLGLAAEARKLVRPRRADEVP